MRFKHGKGAFKNALFGNVLYGNRNEDFSCLWAGPHTGAYALQTISNQCSHWLEQSLTNVVLTKKELKNTSFITIKSIKETLGIILKKVKKIIEDATVIKFQNKAYKL